MSVVNYLLWSGQVFERSSRNVQFFALAVEVRGKYSQLSLNSMLAGRVNSALSATSWDLIKHNNSMRSEDVL